MHETGGCDGRPCCGVHETGGRDGKPCCGVYETGGRDGRPCCGVYETGVCGSAPASGKCSDSAALLKAGEKIEDLLCGNLRIIARRGGFRYGTDSALLANFAKAKRGDRIVELCSGTGAVSILLSEKTRAASILGIEIQGALVDMANRSAALNGISDRVEFIEGDIRNIKDITRAGSADVVTVNPPYLRYGGPACSGKTEAADAGATRQSYNGPINTDLSAAISRHEICCKLADVTSAANWLLNPGGRLYIVYRHERLVDLFYEMRVSGIEPKEMLEVGAGQPDERAGSQPATSADSHPAKNTDGRRAVNKRGRPSLVLVCGVKGAAPGLRRLQGGTPFLR